MFTSRIRAGLENHTVSAHMDIDVSIEDFMEQLQQVDISKLQSTVEALEASTEHLQALSDARELMVGGMSKTSYKSLQRALGGVPSMEAYFQEYPEYMFTQEPTSTLHQVSQESLAASLGINQEHVEEHRRELMEQLQDYVNGVGTTKVLSKYLDEFSKYRNLATKLVELAERHHGDASERIVNAHKASANYDGEWNHLLTIHYTRMSLLQQLLLITRGITAIFDNQSPHADLEQLVQVYDQGFSQELYGDADTALDAIITALKGHLVEHVQSSPPSTIDVAKVEDPLLLPGVQNEYEQLLPRLYQGLRLEGMVVTTKVLRNVADLVELHRVLLLQICDLLQDRTRAYRNVAGLAKRAVTMEHTPEALATMVADLCSINDVQ